jgi:hypothetical protein
MCDAHNLSFVKVDMKADIDNSVNWFAVQSTGNYALDCEVGRQCAYSLLGLLRVRDEWDTSRFWLGNIVMSMLKRDDLQAADGKGFVVGFFSVIRSSCAIICASISNLSAICQLVTLWKVPPYVFCV